MSRAYDYSPDVFFATPSTPLDETVGMATCLQRGWNIAKGTYKKFREVLQRKEKLSLSSLQCRIDVEHEKFPSNLNHSELKVAILATIECLVEFNQYYDDKLFNKHVMEEIQRQFAEKYMIVGVVGRHKAGKSTLLNALLSAEILPTANEKETALPILIVHNPEKHIGLCPLVRSDSGCCSHCPELVIEDVCESITSSSRCCGLKAVTAKLRELNVETRQSPDEAMKKVIMEVNIPMMQDEQGKDIRVFIQDTPGFGASEHEEIKKKTALSMLSSSLLIYVISCKEMEDEKDAVTLKALYEMDPYIVKRGRIVIVVTHLDLRTKPSSDVDEDDNHEEEGCENIVHSRKLYMDVDEVCTIAQSHFAEAAGLPIGKVPKDIIIPVSSEHAILARKAKLCSSDKNKKLVRYTVEVQYREKYSMGGGNIPADAEELERYSQMPVLEMRLRDLLANKKKIWQSSIISALKWHLRTSAQMMASMLEEHEEEYTRLKSRVDAKIKQRQTIQSLDSALSKGLRKHKPSLEAAYDKDIKGCQRQLVEDMVEAFEGFEHKCLETCHAADDEIYNGRRYANDLDDFVSRMSRKLSGMLTTIRFDALDQEDRDMYVNASGMIRDLRAAMEAYCSDDTDLFTDFSIKVYESTQVTSVGDVIAEHPLDFVEVLKTSEILKEDLSFWKKLQLYFKELFGSKSDLQEEQLSDNALHKLLRKANLKLTKITENHFPTVKDSIVSYYFERYCKYVQGKLEELHTKNDKQVDAKYTEVENMRQQQRIKEKLCILLRQENSHCQLLLKQLSRLEHQDIEI